MFNIEFNIDFNIDDVARVKSALNLTRLLL
jgi:hypothetical protein